ncbi:MAG: hypothetical protein IJH07_01165 [Ruminococcus sp.]|nr:hypothetical protein [Ruminococcus sp.]
MNKLPAEKDRIGAVDATYQQQSHLNSAHIIVFLVSIITYHREAICLSSAVITFKLGTSLSPSIMTGGTFHQKGALPSWRED